MADQPKPWTGDPLWGAQLITAYAHGLLTGPCGVAFMRQSALGPGADLNAKALMDTAETLAVEAMRRSWDRRETAGPLAAFFQQTPAPGTHLCGGGIQP
jgi:hypothetical protein